MNVKKITKQWCNKASVNNFVNIDDNELLAGMVARKHCIRVIEYSITLQGNRDMAMSMYERLRHFNKLSGKTMYKILNVKTLNTHTHVLTMQPFYTEAYAASDIVSCQGLLESYFKTIADGLFTYIKILDWHPTYISNSDAKQWRQYHRTIRHLTDEHKLKICMPLLGMKYKTKKTQGILWNYNQAGKKVLLVA